MKILSAFLTLLLSLGTAMAYEEPEYELVAQYPDFELRQYKPYIVAETVVTGSFREVGNEGFRILFAYISGENRNGIEIPMTAPVEQKPVKDAGIKIAMTAPVIQSPSPDDNDTSTISFVMPSSFTMETLPEPLDPRVTLRKVGGKRVAARFYKGSWSEKRYQDNETRLLQALEDGGLTISGQPVFAGYNSPVTPWFLRRNEVLVGIR